MISLAFTILGMSLWNGKKKTNRVRNQMQWLELLSVRMRKYSKWQYSKLCKYAPRGYKYRMKCELKQKCLLKVECSRSLVDRWVWLVNQRKNVCVHARKEMEGDKFIKLTLIVNKFDFLAHMMLCCATFSMQKTRRLPTGKMFNRQILQTLNCSYTRAQWLGCRRSWPTL